VTKAPPGKLRLLLEHVLMPVVNRFRALPVFLRNLRTYRRLNRDERFAASARELFYTTYDRYAPAGAFRRHYFLQDLWAARRVFAARPARHVDVGSRIDGFVAHVMAFCPVTYVDLRPADVPGLDFRQGSILQMPFETGSVPSLSSLHVIEHIGLGRYGDDVEPDGWRKAAGELARVLAPGGMLLVGAPVGRQRLVFDAHRIFDPRTLLDAFAGLRLEEFSLIDDSECLTENASFDQALTCRYGCGLLRLRK
jgi:SAM-dependent methyltransferase